MYIWGTAESGKKAFDLLNGKENIEGFIDSYFDGEIINICGKQISVLRPQDIIEISNKAEVCLVIASSAYEKIIMSLCETNIRVVGIYNKVYNCIDTYASKYENTIYSQDGEEVLLREYYAEKNNGTYVDVGALHPYRFSNTYWAYKRGWRGINIEPNVDQFGLLKKFRPEDINLNIGIGNKNENLCYYKYSEPAYNSFIKEESINKKLIAIETVPVKKLCDVFRENNIEEIDFMSIDVEGFEMEVLKSNDWIRYRPEWILLEQLDFEIDNYAVDEKCCFLKEQGYKFHSKYNRTVFWKNDLDK